MSWYPLKHLACDALSRSRFVQTLIYFHTEVFVVLLSKKGFWILPQAQKLKTPDKSLKDLFANKQRVKETAELIQRTHLKSS